MSKTIKQKLFDLIDEYDIHKFFEKIDTLGGYDKAICNKFRKEFMAGNIAYDYLDRLRVFINSIEFRIEENDINIFNSIVIDGVFLEKVINQTKNVYQKIYPNKKLNNLLNIYDLLMQFCQWGYIELEKELNCYLIYSSHFALEDVVDIGDKTVESILSGNYEETYDDKFNLYKFKTDDFITFKVEEQLTRIINTENVLLVADDPAYVPYLKKLEDKGIEITILQMKEDSGSLMYHNFSYQDIMYPIGMALGLKREEL